MCLQPEIQVGVITALRREASLLAGPRVELDRVIHLDPGVCVYVGGMGFKRAHKAAGALIDAGCRALVSFGTAGGLHRELSAGSLVIPERILEEGGEAHEIDPDWRSRLLEATVPGLGAQPQVLISVSRPVLACEQKTSLAEISGACAVDMESAAIARQACARGIPLLVVRAVSDDSRQSLPAGLMPALDVYGQTRTLSLLKALCLQPGIIRRLPALARGVSAAEGALAEVVSRTGLRFCV